MGYSGRWLAPHTGQRGSEEPQWIRWALAAILALYFVLALAYNVADPVFEPPDELLHYNIISYLLREQALPVVQLTDPPSEYHQPPVYYTLAALVTSWIPQTDIQPATLRNPFWAYDIGGVSADNKNQFLHGPEQAFPYQGVVLAVHVARLLSTVAGAATVYFSFRLALALTGGQAALALATTALVAFTPNFLLTAAAVTNDALISLLPTAAVLVCFRLLDQADPPRPRQWLLLGLLLSLTILVKVSGYPALLVAALLAAILAARQHSWKAFITAGAILTATVLVLTGWWFARNLALYHDLTGLGQMWKVWGSRPPLTLAQLRLESWSFFITYWADFGYGNVPVPNPLYNLIVALLSLGALGSAWRVADFLRGHPPTLRTRHLVLLAVWLIATVAALLWYWQHTIQVTGRQIFAIIPALSFFLVWGWARLVPRRWHTYLAGATGSGMLALATYALGFSLVPAYASAPRLPSPQANVGIPHRLDWNLGSTATLLGYDLSPRTVQPGQIAQVTLYWQSLATTAHNYTVFLHLYGADGALVGARDTYPGLGNNPTLYWRPGEVLQDTIPVRIAADAAGPILLSVEAGLYDLETSQRLPIQAASRAEVVRPIIGQIKLAQTAQPLFPMQPLSAAFTDGPALIGYHLSATDLPAGQTLTVTLRWAAAGPLTRDYTVFVQLVDRAGHIAAQGDRPPKNGLYPTTAWGAGETIDDAHPVALPPDIPPGAYSFLVGLYDPVDGTRLVTGPLDYVHLDHGLTIRTAPQR